MEHRQRDYYSYWAKVSKSVSDEEPKYHLLVYHLLDVLAVGRQFIQLDPHMVRILSESGAELSFEESRSVLSFFLALHDIGKFARTFQGLQVDVLRMMGVGTERRYAYSTRHDVLGYLLWEESLISGFREILRNESGEALSMSGLRELCRPLVSASTGHHGVPPAMKRRVADYAFGSEDKHAADEFLAAIVGFVFEQGVPALFKREPETQWLDAVLPRLSWLFAGFTVFCDWVGSNQDYFRMKSERMPIEEYYHHHALPQAKKAIRELRLLPVDVRMSQTLQKLFGFEQHTPLQVFTENHEIHDGPNLFILEDLTGSGKTEAALNLAYRLMKRNGADGLYFALPTQATANGIYDRVGSVYRRFYAEGSDPSIVLAHSGRQFNKLFASSLGDFFIAGKVQKSYGGNASEHVDHTAESSCSAWLADDSRKTFLAQTGVGTVDQALMSILPRRFQSLRLYGLARKVLIVDEVHAYDSYMKRLLERLLSFHASFGGSAILLSATLPYRMRVDLAKAFLQHVGDDVNLPEDRAYPLATHISPNTGNEVSFPLRCRSGSERRIRFTFVQNEAEVVERMLQVSAGDGCVCWIRNTVADAVRAYSLLVDAAGHESVELFHARFTMGDRRDIENRVLGNYGKHSTTAMRRGRILIATQVVEQSLDLDFDSMISDLAPVDLLLQRSGRLHRHERGERGMPELIVLAPAFTAQPEADWYAAMFSHAAYVYKDHAQLWLTMRVLLGNGCIHRLPEDSRTLIESVYGVEAEAGIPEGLLSSHTQNEGVEHANAALARLKALEVTSGYVPDGFKWEDDQDTATRLDTPSVKLILLKLRNGLVVPWCEDDDGGFSLSSLTYRAHFFSSYPKDDELLLREFVDRNQKYFRWAKPLLLHEGAAGQWRGRSVDKEGNVHEWRYSKECGLREDRSE